jgi:hypothetical protein
MLGLIETLGVRAEAEAKVAHEERAALDVLDAINAPGDGKEPLRSLMALLGSRAH